MPCVIATNIGASPIGSTITKSVTNEVIKKVVSINVKIKVLFVDPYSDQIGRSSLRAPYKRAVALELVWRIKMIRMIKSAISLLSLMLRGI